MPKVFSEVFYYFRIQSCLLKRHVEFKVYSFQYKISFKNLANNLYHRPGVWLLALDASEGYELESCHI